MAQNDQNRDGQNDPEGYQDPNEQDSRSIQSDSSESEKLNTRYTPQRLSQISEPEDLDEEDRDDDMREGAVNRRRRIN